MAPEHFESIFILAGDRELLLSRHVQLRIEQRGISVEWIAQAIDSPVFVEEEGRKNSANYFGIVEGRNHLLKVAISKSDGRTIVTAYFDTGATRRRQRGEI